MKLPNGQQSTVGDVVVDLMSKDTLQSLPFYSSRQSELTGRVIDAEVILPSEDNSGGS